MRLEGDRCSFGDHVGFPAFNEVQLAREAITAACHQLTQFIESRQGRLQAPPLRGKAAAFDPDTTVFGQKQGD